VDCELKKAFTMLGQWQKALLRKKQQLLASYVIVQASAPQGNEVALFQALFSTWTVYLLMVSPPLCGSNPYPCGSLTYRSY